jgi:hypothetical protein
MDGAFIKTLLMAMGRVFKIIGVVFYLLFAFGPPIYWGFQAGSDNAFGVVIPDSTHRQ